MSGPLDNLLMTAMELGASDLHLAVPNPPVVRLNGSLQAFDNYPPLTPELTAEILVSVTSDTQREAKYHS